MRRTFDDLMRARQVEAIVSTPTKEAGTWPASNFAQALGFS
jgi:hypothetical protein